MKTLGSILLILICISIWLSSCKHKPDVIPSKTKDTTGTKIDTTTIKTDTTKKQVIVTCSPDTVYFTNVILPLIASNCGTTGCHNSVSRVEGLDLTSYSGIMAIVSPNSPNGSKLYTHITGIKKIMPPSGKLPQTDIDSITKWINQGAKNNSCDASSFSCDSTNISYAASIVPIVNTYCKGCHNATVLSGGIRLDLYSGIQQVAQNGQLTGAITGTLPLMPQSGGKLSICDIGILRNWVKEGAKNN